MLVLVTGGAGFIGSHTCVELLRQGHDVVVADDYSNSSPAAIAAVRDVAGRPPVTYRADLRDYEAVSRIFSAHPIEAVIHFAAKKSVRESVQIPIEYFDVNIGGTTNLIRAMLDHGVRQLVFSSSCSIYGDGYDRPISEDDPPAPTNPYARSKLVCEQMLADVCVRYQDFSVIALRYFNPVGAHPSGLLGEAPLGIPSNVMPYLLQVAMGKLARLQVFGSDYPTPDGSGVRDYIHVMDVADAHRIALERLPGRAGMQALNLGTGTGISVLELIATFESECGVTIPYEIVGRQPGDVAALIADPIRAGKEWGWRTTRDIRAMCADAWRFQQRHPDGYTKPLGN
jgi:UDP-glucose 4-epimerase